MVLVTGATGFIGGHLVPRLLADGQALRALVRPGGARRFLEKRGVEVAAGDVTEPSSLTAACRGAQAVIHLVGLIRERPGQTFECVVAEGTRSLVKAAEAAGVERFVYLSAIGASRAALSRYHRTKTMAEEAVRAAAIEHVIIRPSVVYGPGDGLVSMFNRLPVPIVGDGKNLVQPVYVEDLVQVLAESLKRPEVVNQTFELGGRHPMTFAEMVQIAGAVSGRRLPHPRLPRPLAEAQASLFDSLSGPLYRFGLEPPLTRDMLLMLSEDNTCDIARVTAAFGFEPVAFEDGLRRYLRPAAA